MQFANQLSNYAFGKWTPDLNAYGDWLCVLHVSAQKLQEALHLHEFKRVSSDLEDWISQQRQIASSENYGTDYNNVLVRTFPQNSFSNLIIVLRQYISTFLVLCNDERFLRNTTTNFFVRSWQSLTMIILKFRTFLVELCAVMNYCKMYFKFDNC